MGTARTMPTSSLAPHSLDPALAALTEHSEVKQEFIPKALGAQLEQSSSGRPF